MIKCGEIKAEFAYQVNIQTEWYFRADILNFQQFKLSLTSKILNFDVKY